MVKKANIPPISPLSLEPEIEEMFEPENIAIDAAIRELGESSAVVNVFREGPGGYRDLFFLFSVPPTEWLQGGYNRIQSQYGSGTYRIYVRRESGEIAANRKVQVEAIPGAPVGIQPAPVVNPQENAIAQAIAAMTESNNRLAAAFMVRPAENPIATLDGIAKIAAMFNREPVERAPSMDINTVLNTAQQLLALTNSMKPAPALVNADGEVSEMGVLSTVIQSVVEMYKATKGQPGALANTQQPASPTGELTAPVAQLPENIEPPESEEETEMKLIQAMMVLQLKKAVKQAAAGNDPVVYAETAYGMIPDAELNDFASDAQWFEKMCVLCPECAPHRAWFEKARTQIIALAVADELIEPIQEAKPAGGEAPPAVAGDGDKPKQAA